MGVDVKSVKDLRRGDHVAWQTFPGYWHHAIVAEDEKEEVFEFNQRGLCRTLFMKPTSHKVKGMYKMTYPSGVIQTNRVDDVINRAEEGNLPSNYCLCTNNCEHFATYCKMGASHSDQPERCCCKVYTWCTVLVLLIGYIINFGLVRCVLQQHPNVVLERGLSLAILPVTEALRRLISVVIIIKGDLPKLKQWLHGNEEPLQAERCMCFKCKKACLRAVRRQVLKGICCIVCIIAAMSIVHFVGPLSDRRNHQSDMKRIFVDVAAGIVGIIIGTLLYHICRNLRRLIKSKCPCGEQPTQFPVSS